MLVWKVILNILKHCYNQGKDVFEACSNFIIIAFAFWLYYWNKRRIMFEGGVY